MLKYPMMKTHILLIFTALLTGCSPASRSALVRSYNLHSNSYVTSEELVQRMRSNPDYYIIVDTRPAADYEKAHIKGAINYPKSYMDRSFRFKKSPLGSMAITRPLLIYNEKGYFYGGVRRFLDAKVPQPLFFLELGFSQWIGAMEGTDTGAILERNRKLKDAYDL